MAVVGVAMADTASNVRSLMSLWPSGAGVVTTIAPVGVSDSRLLFRDIVSRLGMTPPPDKVGVRVDASTELALAWFRVLPVSGVVILHPSWLSSAVLLEAIAILAGAGLDVFLPGDATSLAALGHSLVSWMTEEWSWDEFQTWADQRCLEYSLHRATLEANDALPLPHLGLADPARWAGPEHIQSTSVDAMRIALHDRLGPDPNRAEICAQVRGLLRPRVSSQGAYESALAGVATALEELGFELQAARAQVHATWGAVRRIAGPNQGASLALLGANLPPRTVATVTVADTAPDGSAVSTRWGSVAVPAGARQIVAVQRSVRASDAGGAAPLVDIDGRTPSLHELVSLAADALGSVGLKFPEAAIGAGFTSTERWLQSQGLGIRRVRRLGATERPFGAVEIGLLCGHRLPSIVAVGNLSLSHSHRLCKAVEAADCRPAEHGYTVRLERQAAGVARYSVTQGSRSAGSLWSIETGLGRVWLQHGLWSRPSAQSIAAAVGTLQNTSPAHRITTN